MGNKKIKTEKDYIKELVEIYPVMSEEEMGKLVEQVTSVVTKHVRGGHRGVSFGTNSSLLDDVKARFKITKAPSRKAERTFKIYQRKKKNIK